MFSDVLRQMAATRPIPTYRCFSLSHLDALSPQSERLEHASQPETRGAKKNYFPGQVPLFGRVGTSTYLDLNLPQLKLGLQKGGALDPLQCFLSIVYPRKEAT